MKNVVCESEFPTLLIRGGSLPGLLRRRPSISVTLLTRLSRF